MKSFEPLTDSVFYIMASLTEPRHGYAVMTFVEETTKGMFVIGPASLYTIIKKLLKEQLIVLHDESDSRRKVYTLTKIGRQTLEADIVRRKVMIEMAEKGLKRGNL
ncbi:PadR family transcriptional regulator [Sporosarcina newyorkensis 2681]|uniref:PadR family transcriptional regulator n=1 Tax=Sporosarcina newyorkensis 2681 TaxID=1027292 RepID=F9DRK9_9BACL|nr:PadR family transcriptional regulator [Sporosarcina newyorkensis]EGQ26512.1 PadR family transcriptional regulator [Sporosarcina newyorkensis 2681]